MVSITMNKQSGIIKPKEKTATPTLQTIWLEIMQIKQGNYETTPERPSHFKQRETVPCSHSKYWQTLPWSKQVSNKCLR